MADRWHGIERVVTTRHHELLAFAMLLADSDEDAQVALHDAYLTVYSSQVTFDHSEADSYVRRAMCTRYVNGVGRRPRSLVFTMIAGPEAPASDNSSGNPVHQVLADLPARDRAVALLTYTDDATPQECGAILGRSASSIQAALELISTSLGPYGGARDVIGQVMSDRARDLHQPHRQAELAQAYLGAIAANRRQRTVLMFSAAGVALAALAAVLITML